MDRCDCLSLVSYGEYDVIEVLVVDEHELAEMVVRRCCKWTCDGCHNEVYDYNEEIEGDEDEVDVVDCFDHVTSESLDVLDVDVEDVNDYGV